MARRLAALLLPLLAAAAVQAAAGPACHTYTSKGLIQPAIGSLQDVIVVQDSYIVNDASVTLDVAHRRIGALKISLGAAPFSNSGAPATAHPTIILKTHGQGRRGDNLYRTTFNDNAATTFPINASDAPFTGTWRPVQRMSFLYDGTQTTAGSGGSQGLWTLTIADVAPNNTLREIHLNGWTLVLCEAANSAPAGPSPSPSPSPAPVPPVIASNGPPEPTGSGAGSGSGSGSVGTPGRGSGLFGWQVVYKNQPPDAAGPAPSPPVPGTGMGAGIGSGSVLGATLQPWQQLLQQRPVLTMMEQNIAAIASGIGGNCDEACAAAKQKLWRAAVFGLYFHAMAEHVHHKRHPDQPSLTHAWLERMQDFLPGDNERLAKLQAWMEERHTEMRGLGDWLRAHLKVPDVGSLHITLPNIQLGGGDVAARLQAALASGGDRLKAVMGMFAAAGDGLGSLAKGLASSQVNSAKQLASVVGSNWQQWQQAMGTNAGALASMFAQGADALAAAAVGGIDRVSDVAGRLDSRGEAVHAFLNSMTGESIDQVTQQSLSEISKQLGELFGQ
ncbi:neuroendocrine convertase 1 [Chlorella sorokiniana]|uniref:Neuroendocrine convertase 1 n=1 Tax=Chlorella sorokiniana TaxID=3076 RepID=A0A2P6TB36_CHLSO|nr:neuroendocrine convertase 1 [Chlorella sorokiniana]|eukprot:PRW05765.1 neuroendocrine convertase 1 [Chlorella sorokiniana]